MLLAVDRSTIGWVMVMFVLVRYTDKLPIYHSCALHLQVWSWQTTLEDVGQCALLAVCKIHCSSSNNWESKEK